MKTRNLGWLVVVTLVVGLCSAQAQTVPEMINYQGKLMDGTNLFSGTVPITFRLYDAPTGGMFPYCEDSNDVVVVDGLYSTYIGDDVVFGSLDNALIQTQVWIEVVIGTNVIEPREQMVSVGYARYAAKMPANAVTMDMIAPDAVQYYHIADNQVRGNHIQAGTISNANLAAGSVSADKIASNSFWQLTGNAGTTAGTHFLGTTDDRPVEIYANNQRVLRLDNSFTMPNITVGEPNNAINPNAGSATISGGGGLGGGNPNRVTDNYGTIGGGAGNVAGDDGGSVFSAEYATVGGGQNNTAAETAATVGGGEYNTAEADYATVGGGQNNTAGGATATVSGGRDNDAAAEGATVSGGAENAADSDYATIAGGANNAAGTYAALGGGWMNTAGAEYSTVGGGVENNAFSPFAVVAGGDHNRASGPRSAIGGGSDNVIEVGATNSVIAGGSSNAVSGYFSSVGGGLQNTAGNAFSTVGGGWTNTASNAGSTVGGGWRNTASGYGSTIGGGLTNIASAWFATIGGGAQNFAGGGWWYPTVGGGYRNTARASHTIIPGGKEAKADQYGQMAHASGAFTDPGDAQASEYILRRETTSAGSWEDLYLDGLSQHLMVTNTKTMTFQALVVGRSDSGAESAGYRIEGLLIGGVGGANVAGVTVSMIYEDDAIWDADVQGTPGGHNIRFMVRGNGENIRWVATVRTSEVGW